MNWLLRETLDRTLLLMRDELRANVSDGELLAALTGTEVLLVGDADNLSSHAAQCAFVTAALLMARSGHRVYLAAPEVALQEPQPPLKSGTLISALLEVGNDLLPGVDFSAVLPPHMVDLCVCIGDSRPCINARRVIALNASAWSGWIGPLRSASRWRERDWPFGGLVAGALVAGEAFKISIRKLQLFAAAPKNFNKLFAPSAECRFELAPSHTPQSNVLGNFDFISGGAITNAALYALLRIPRHRGSARIIENTIGDHSNLNRYALLRRSDVLAPKTETLLNLDSGDLELHSVPVRYDERSAEMLAPLASRVLVGVDHIPTRWLVQQMQPGWLGVGATTHWSTMTSFHVDGLACARCLHPRDDENDAPIPTVAFVSFWAGLLLASYFIRVTAGGALSAHEQHIFLTPLRPESAWWGPVGQRLYCLTCDGDVRAA